MRLFQLRRQLFKNSFYLLMGIFFLISSFQNCSFHQNFDINKAGFELASLNPASNSVPSSPINTANNETIIGPDGSMKIESFVQEDHPNAVYPTFSVFDPQVNQYKVFQLNPERSGSYANVGMDERNIRPTIYLSMLDSASQPQFISYLSPYSYALLNASKEFILKTKEQDNSTTSNLLLRDVVSTPTRHSLLLPFQFFAVNTQGQLNNIKYSYCSNNNTVDTVRFCFRQNIVPLKEDSLYLRTETNQTGNSNLSYYDHQIVDYQDSMDIQLQATDQGANSYQSISGGEFGNKKYIHWRLKKNNELTAEVVSISSSGVVELNNNNYIYNSPLVTNSQDTSKLVQANVLQALNGFFIQKNSQTSLLELKFAMLIGDLNATGASEPQTQFQITTLKFPSNHDIDLTLFKIHQTEFLNNSKAVICFEYSPIGNSGDMPKPNPMLPIRPCFEMSILSQSNRHPFVQPQLSYLIWSRFGLENNANVMQISQLSNGLPDCIKHKDGYLYCNNGNGIGGMPDVAFKTGPQSYGKIESSGWFHLYNYHKFRPMGCLGYHGDVGFQYLEWKDNSMEGNGGSYSAYVVNERLSNPNSCRIELSTPIKIPDLNIGQSIRLRSSSVTAQGEIDVMCVLSQGKPKLLIGNSNTNVLRELGLDNNKPIQTCK